MGRDEAKELETILKLPDDLIDCPERIPRIDESNEITLRFPKIMIDILEEFARRKNMNLNVMIKKWLDDRIRIERDELFK